VFGDLGVYIYMNMDTVHENTVVLSECKRFVFNENKIYNFV